MEMNRFTQAASYYLWFFLLFNVVWCHDITKGEIIYIYIHIYIRRYMFILNVSGCYENPMINKNLILRKPTSIPYPPASRYGEQFTWE